ncbi:MAG: hypothetical protein PT965_05630 [Clostridia bacterium]|nr:hypothetical protein [Clostridia bacterium]MDY2929346.1 hypothetical protein [Clostridiaceae bacterium]
MSKPLKLICALVLALALAVVGVTLFALKWDRDFKRFCAVLSACTAYTQGQYKCHVEGADGDVNVCPENLAFLYRKVAASYPSSRTKSVPENDHFVVHYADGSDLTVTRVGEEGVHLAFVADYGDGRPIRFSYRMKEDLNLTYDSLAQYVSLAGSTYPNKAWIGN